MTANLDASESAFEKYRSYLCLLARQQLGAKLRGKLDASDVVQEALFQAHACRGQFRGTTEPERIGWLQAILMNTLAGAFRQFGRLRRDVDLEVSLETQLRESSTRLANFLVSDASSPSEKVGRHEQLLELAAALSELPVDQREAIEMHHLQGMTLSQIAEVMERSKPSVAGLIFRGVTTVRRRLESTNSEDHEFTT